MAEQVQAILDRMVPALRDLLDKEIFSEVSWLFISPERTTNSKSLH